MCKTWRMVACGHSSVIHFSKTLAKVPKPLPDVIAEVQGYLRSVCDQKLNLEDLARRFALDKYQLIRHFKRQVGLTPNGYLTQVRIEQAMRLLAQGRTPVEVALETGFYDQSHFARYFRSYTGVTPRRYQKSCPVLPECP